MRWWSSLSTAVFGSRMSVNTRSRRELQDTPPASEDGIHHEVIAMAVDNRQESNNSQNDSKLRLLAGASQTENIEAGPRKKHDLRFNRRQWIANRPVWVTTVSVGLGLAAIAMIVNASILGWIYNSFGPISNGTAVLFSGSCSKASMLTTVSHLAINILSTLLLAASNNCAQLLCSPTRAEVDKAHRNGQWLHVGIFSYRNLPRISYWRFIACGCLILSSIPLHLL
jgi:hypothetical protein